MCAGGFEGKMYFVVCGSSVFSLCFASGVTWPAWAVSQVFMTVHVFDHSFTFYEEVPRFLQQYLLPCFPFVQIINFVRVYPNKTSNAVCWCSHGMNQNKRSHQFSPRVNLFLRKSLRCLSEKTENVFKFWKCTSNSFLSVVSCASVYHAVIV